MEPTPQGHPVYLGTSRPLGNTSARRHKHQAPYDEYFLTRTHTGTITALLPLTRRTNAFDHNETMPLPEVEVRPSPGRGLGLFATKAIAAYSRIMVDPALLIMAPGEDLPQLWTNFKSLPLTDQKLLRSLAPPQYHVDKEPLMIEKLVERHGYNRAEARKMAYVSSCFTGNSFKVSGDHAGDWDGGHALFPNVARINHSCTPNAHSHFRGSSGEDYVYALLDIEAGEEIEISYFNITESRNVCQQRTVVWSFTCTCPACSGSLGHQYEKDRALVAAGLALSTGSIHAQKSVPATTIQAAINVALSAKYPWFRSTLPDLYSHLYLRLVSDGVNQENAMRLHKETTGWATRIYGRDSPQAS